MPRDAYRIVAFHVAAIAVPVRRSVERVKSAIDKQRLAKRTQCQGEHIGVSVSEKRECRPNAIRRRSGRSQNRDGGPPAPNRCAYGVATVGKLGTSLRRFVPAASGTYGDPPPEPQRVFAERAGHSFHVRALENGRPKLSRLRKSHIGDAPRRIDRASSPSPIRGTSPSGVVIHILNSKAASSCEHRPRARAGPGATSQHGQTKNPRQ